MADFEALSARNRLSIAYCGLKMRSLLLTVFVLTVGWANAQTKDKMKLNAGIITEKLQETKKFYTEVLGFGITFENEFYLLMHTPDKSAELGFLLPNHPSQKPIFQSEFNGKGVYLTIEVENVDEIYKQLVAKGIQMEIEIRDEPWGDRHFAIVDPNGIGVDIVTYTKPEE
jgi:catechol 2,3-dioxygenase-like lactoylglutathione lyase family enzyme